MHSMKIPLAIKVLHTFFASVLIPSYWLHYGPGNFLWFSDIALVLSVMALWMESSFLASMQATAVVLLELAWIADFLVRLFCGVHLVGLSRYMFEAKNPLFIRLLSLFHLWLPLLLLWMVYEFGYDRRGWLAQTALAWVVLPLTYLLTNPSQNVNWVYGFGHRPQQRLPEWLYVIVLMVAFPLFVYWPSHLMLVRLMPERP